MNKNFIYPTKTNKTIKTAIISWTFTSNFKTVFTKEELKSNTIFPNVTIKQSIKDYIYNTDYVLEKVLEEISK